MPKATVSFRVLFLALTVLTILLLVPFSDAFVFDTKKLVLFVAGFIVVGASAINLFKSRSLVITLSPFCLTLGLLGLSTILSSLLTGQYPHEALFGWGGALLMTTIVAGLGYELLHKKDLKSFELTLVGSAAGLAVITLLQAVGYGPSHLYNRMFGTTFPHNALFSLTESTLVALQVMLVAGAAWVGIVLQKHERLTQPLYAGLGALVAMGILVAGWATFINPDTKLLNSQSLSTNMAVARGVLSSVKSALVGVGPHAYGHAYSRFKPAIVNTTPAWDIEFATGVNFPLTIVVGLGLVGLVSWALLIFFIIKQVITKSALRTEPLTLALVVLITTQLLFPPTIVMVVLFGVVLAFWLAIQAAEFEKIKMHTLITRLSPDQSRAASMSITHVLSIALAAVMVIFTLAGIYGSFRAFAASYYFYRSTTALAKNQPASQIYDLQRQAVALNPYIDINRRRYALTNLAVAQALAAKPDLTDPEREQVLTLIQQAIREGRAATMIQPDDARNWETLGAIYQNLIAVATGADQWTVNSYTRAIENDPNNPVLWFQLGSTFLSGEQYAEASRLFAQAVQLKPDYLNAYYNLANALRMSNQFAEAKQVYQELLNRVPTNSAEYSLVQSELVVVEGLISTQSQNASPSGQPETSVIEDSLTTPEQTVPVQNTDLSNEAQEYLEATPVGQ